MIAIGIVLDDKGCIKSFKSQGHALGESGSNIPCAAASIMIRSTARMLEKVLNEAFILHSLEEGLIDFSVKGGDAGSEGFLSGIAAVLVQGLQDLENDYPEQVTVTIDYRRRTHGS